MEQGIYTAKTYRISGLSGISDDTLQMHVKLYAGYVDETNRLNEELAKYLQGGKIDQSAVPTYSELKRRLAFEYNGMLLHELYFGNLRRQGSGEPNQNSLFREASEAAFGSFDLWKADFIGVGMMRGIGWAVCLQDPITHRLSNHWVDQHETGLVAGFNPILVMDVWEHAYLLDYSPSDRRSYIDAFFSNVDWATVEERIETVASVGR